MTPEIREYKIRTLNQLLATLPQLESHLAVENEPATARQLSKQVEEMQAHAERLRQELVTNSVHQPVADELCQKAAKAIIKQKLYLAQKCINDLATIEPFYPGLDRLRQDVETGKISRRTRSIAEGNSPPFLLTSVTFSPPLALSADNGTSSPLPATFYVEPAIDEEKRSFWANLFQFHILASLFVVMLILCIMVGVGSTAVLQWLIEGR